MRTTTLIAAALAATAEAAQDARTFAVLHFQSGDPLLTARVDPIVDAGKVSSHVHAIQGGSNIGVSSTGEELMKSKCSSATIEGDLSAYWMPTLFFRDPNTGALESVPFYYMNVYYFFEPTDDDIVPFPTGLQMVSGNKDLRDCPDFGGETVLDGGSENGTQPLQWTCPRTNYADSAWPTPDQSDGKTAGIAAKPDSGAGQGFPFGECDGLYSPLRHDLHFPSCYDPSKDLTDYENNMAYPTVNYATGKQNCPEGWIHTPHIFYEQYWNTQLFAGRWTPNQGSQPFVLSNGDMSGCSGHGDMIAAWDQATLQNIIDNCDQGDLGMEKCPGVVVRDQTNRCESEVPPPVDEQVTGNVTALPGNNPLVGWGMSFGNSAMGPASGSPTPAAPQTGAPAASGLGSESTVIPKADVPAPLVESAIKSIQSSAANAAAKCAGAVRTVTVTAGAEETYAKRDENLVNHHAHRHVGRHWSRHLKL